MVGRARESGPRRRQWLDCGQRERGLGAKLALHERGIEGGMIQYGPVYFVHGPPPSYATIRKVIRSRVARL